jgi:hypothetical protein
MDTQNQFEEVLPNTIAIEIADQVVLPDEDAELDGSYLAGCLKRQMEALLDENIENESFDFSVFPCAIKSPSVWVTKKDNFEPIKKVSDVIELLNSLTDITQIDTYSGHDHAEVFVLNGVLPEKYIAQVRNVMLRHIPSSFLKAGADKIFAVEMAPFGKTARGKKKLVCRGVTNGGIRTDAAWEDVSRKEIARHYHNVTVKINRATQRLVAWFPGLDVYSNVCDGLEGQFVEIQQYDQFIKSTATQTNQKNAPRPNRLRLRDLK